MRQNEVRWERMFPDELEGGRLRRVQWCIYLNIFRR